MADPALHIKDGYFFEVPKALWRANYSSLEQVPAFLRKAHPSTSLEEFNSELSGKILIPQPFGTLKNLHDAESGFCLSKFMLIEAVVAIGIFLLLTRYAKAIQSGACPRGKLMTLVDIFVLFIRDKIARLAIDGHDDHEHDDHGHDEHASAAHADGSTHSGDDQHGGHGKSGHGHAPAHKFHEGDRFVPVLATLFFFILGCNLAGMIPWVGAPTGAFGTTISLALVTFATVVVAGVLKWGPIGFFTNMIPTMNTDGMPLPLKLFLGLIKVAILAIELVGLLIKHGVLAIRLLANIVAGHLVLVNLTMIIVSAATATAAVFGTSVTLVTLGCAALSILELAVCFLQAYVFTFLSALFISASVHHH